MPRIASASFSSSLRSKQRAMGAQVLLADRACRAGICEGDSCRIETQVGGTEAVRHADISARGAGEDAPVGRKDDGRGRGRRFPGSRDSPSRRSGRPTRSACVPPPRRRAWPSPETLRSRDTSRKAKQNRSSHGDPPSHHPLRMALGSVASRNSSAPSRGRHTVHAVTRAPVLRSPC
jgi:hypothetical protein